MQYFRSLGIFSILYFFSLLGIFAISTIENKIVLISTVLLYVELIMVIVLYYMKMKQYTIMHLLAIALSLSFLIYLIHLLVTLPFSLMFIADDMSYAGLQKSALTVIRVLITLQLYTVIIFFLQAILKKENIKLSKSFLAFFIVLVIASLTPVEYFQVKFIYLLNSFLPMFFILFILTHLLLLNKKINIQNKIVPYLNASFYLVALWAISGYLYGIVLYFDNWEVFDIATLYSLKGYEPIEGLPRSWWIPINDIMVFRFPSTFENPITASYFAAFFAMISVSLRQYLLGIIFFIFTLVSISKGAILFLFLAIIIIISSRISLILRILLLRIFNSPLILAILLTSYITLQIFVSEIVKSSASIHILGLTLPFINIEQYSIFELFFGYGIGSGGNFFKSAVETSLDNSVWLKSGAESGIGTIFYQLGILGLTLITWINYKIIFLLRTIEARFIFFFYFTSMFLQENLINFNLLILVFFTVIVIEFNKNKKDFTND